MWTKTPKITYSQVIHLVYSVSRTHWVTSDRNIKQWLISIISNHCENNSDDWPQWAGRPPPAATWQWMMKGIDLSHSPPSLPPSLLFSPVYSWRHRWLGWWPCLFWLGQRGWCWPPAWPGLVARRLPAGPWCRTAASTTGSRSPSPPPWTAPAAHVSCSSMHLSRWPGDSEGERE